MRNTYLTIIFIPSNKSHVATQLPVALELISRGHNVFFLSRDSHIDQDYKVEPCIDKTNIPNIRYTGFYNSDVNSVFPISCGFNKFKSDLEVYLSRFSADAVVLCNDDAALFDRMVVEAFTSKGKHVFLIQESVRPAIRKVPILKKYREKKFDGFLKEIVPLISRKLCLGPFFRKGYAHSLNTTIFAAGETFREQLLSEGVHDSQIYVTGQPRLDGQLTTGTVAKEKTYSAEKVLLYCNQPVNCSQAAIDRVFLKLVETTDKMPDVRLLVKLHPRDLPEEYWLKLLKPGQGSSLLDVTRSQELGRCFDKADAFITIASTTCLEAMEYGLPVGLINYLPIEWYLPYERFGAVISVQSEEDLSGTVETLLFNKVIRKSLQDKAEQVLFSELYLRDGKSAWRIANQIEKMVT